MARLRRLRTVRHVSVQQPWRDKVDVYRLVVTKPKWDRGYFTPYFHYKGNYQKIIRIIYYRVVGRKFMCFH